MKFKMSVVLIILSTATIIGIINLVLDKTSTMRTPGAREQKEAKGDKEPTPQIESFKESIKDTQASDSENEIVTAEEDEPPVPMKEQEMGARYDMNKEDLQKINRIINLKEADLLKEFNDLKARIEKDGLAEKLEDGILSKEKEKEAKEIIEHFALLALENSRRRSKGLAEEDPVFAYKESLQEIREMLNDDLDDDDL